MMKVSPNRRRAGFTLVEVLLAVGLFALGASLLIGVFAAGSAMASGAALRTEAAAQLEALSADLEERLFPVLPDGGTGEARELIDVPFPGNDRLTYTARATYAPGEPFAPGFPRLVRVDVEVRWNSGGRRLALESQYLLTHSVPVGERLRQRFVPGAQISAPNSNQSESLNSQGAASQTGTPQPGSNR